MIKLKNLLALDGISIAEKEINESVKNRFGDSAVIHKIVSESALLKHVSFHVLNDKHINFAISELLRLVELTESQEVKDSLIESYFSWVNDNSEFVFVVEVRR